jgi:hypothetical protein
MVANPTPSTYTDTFTTPGRLGAALHWIMLESLYMIVQRLPPRRTEFCAAVPENREPCKVIRVPPPPEPRVGVTLDTAGVANTTELS